MIRIALCVLLVSLCVGCDQQWRELSAMFVETPAANVPSKLRQKNWPDRNGSGSCVIASSCSVLQWHNRPDLAAKFRKTYAGGQTEKTITDIWKAHKIPYIAPRTNEEYGDPELLQWASDTRRAAIIWYFANHCVTFCGFSVHQGQEVAWLLDNNRIERFIPIPKKQFLTEWRGRYGGWAAVPLLTPAPSLPFPGYEVL
jgi:hypothetical protein